VFLADWLTNSPAGQRSSRLLGVTHSVTDHSCAQAVWLTVSRA
jgi:hypothetical protein